MVIKACYVHIFMSMDTTFNGTSEKLCTTSCKGNETQSNILDITKKFEYYRILNEPVQDIRCTFY